MSTKKTLSLKPTREATPEKTSYHRLRRNHYYFATKFCIFNGSDYENIATNMPSAVDANLVKRVAREFGKYMTSSNNTYPFQPSKDLMNHIDVVQSLRPERAARDLVKSFVQNKVDNFMNPQSVKIVRSDDEVEEKKEVVVDSFPRVYDVTVIDVRKDDDGEEILDIEINISTGKNETNEAYWNHGDEVEPKEGTEGDEGEQGERKEEPKETIPTDTKRTFYGIPRKHIFVHMLGDIDFDVEWYTSKFFIGAEGKDDAEDEEEAEKKKAEKQKFMSEIFKPFGKLRDLANPLVTLKEIEHVGHDGIVRVHEVPDMTFKHPTVPAQVALTMLNPKNPKGPPGSNFPINKFFLKDDAQFFVEQWNLRHPTPMEKGSTHKCSIYFETEIVYVQFFKLQPTFQLYEYYVTRKDFLTSQSRFQNRKDLSTHFGKKTSSVRKTFDVQKLRNYLELQPVFRYIVKSAFQPFGPKGEFAYSRDDARANGLVPRQFTRVGLKVERNDKPCKVARVVIHSEIPWDDEIPETFRLEHGDFVRVNIGSGKKASSHVGVVELKTLKRNKKKAPRSELEQNRLNRYRKQQFFYVRISDEGKDEEEDEDEDEEEDEDKKVKTYLLNNNDFRDFEFLEKYFVIPPSAEITDLVFADPYFTSLEKDDDGKLIEKVQAFVKDSRDQFFANKRVISSLKSPDSDSAVATLSAWLKNRWFLIVLYNVYMRFRYKYTSVTKRRRFGDAMFGLLVDAYRNLHHHSELHLTVSDVRAASTFLVDRENVKLILRADDMDYTRLFVSRDHEDPSGYCHAMKPNKFDMRNQIPSFDQLYRFPVEKDQKKKKKKIEVEDDDYLKDRRFNRTAFVQEHIRTMRWFLNLEQGLKLRRTKNNYAADPSQIRNLEIETFFRDKNIEQGHALLDSILLFEEEEKQRLQQQQQQQNRFGEPAAPVFITTNLLDFIF
jgi:hypothetical protein